jgi:gluconate 2-dehydrogenase gamma chain
MSENTVSRRDILKSLSMGAISGSLLQAIPSEAAQHAHHFIAVEKAVTQSGDYTPKFFTPRLYKTLQTLCDQIIPADADCGGAVEAGAPEFIDLLTSENPTYQLKLGGGLSWLNSTCVDRYGKEYLDCTAQQQKEILNLIAYRESAAKDSSLSHGVVFFSFLRELTADGFFTSEIGIKYLGYIGNTFVRDFKGCPPVEGV